MPLSTAPSLKTQPLRPTQRRYWRVLPRLCGVFALLIALLCASTVQAAESAPDNTPTIPIHVVANGWHAGILLPADELNALLPALRQRFPSATQYEIGWGDVGFYQAKEITARLVFEALFASKGAVLHVVGLTDRGAAAILQDSDVVRTCVSRTAYRRMSAAIAQSFVLDSDGQPVTLGPGIYGNSTFYQANGHYSLRYTCNRWAASILQTAGLATYPALRLTAASVLDTARKHAKSCANE